MIVVPNLDNLVALLHKVEPALDHIYPFLAEVTVVGDSRDDADQVVQALRPRVDSRLFLLAVDRQAINRKGVARGKTRAAVIMVDRLLLGTETVRELYISLITTVGFATDINDTRQLVVGLDGQPFYRN